MATVDSIEYRPIENFPGYRVGSDGSVWIAWRTCRAGRRLTDRWKLMKQGVNAKGYCRVNLTPPDGGKYKTFRVHRLVLTAFVGPCPDGMECRHLNGCKTDNRVENLAWGTPEQNVDDNRNNGAYANHKRNKRFTHEGKTMCLKEWASHFSIPYLTLWKRINTLSMTFEEAVDRPYLGTDSNGFHWTQIKRAKHFQEDATTTRGATASSGVAFDCVRTDIPPAPADGQSSDHEFHIRTPNTPGDVSTGSSAVTS